MRNSDGCLHYKYIPMTRESFAESSCNHPAFTHDFVECDCAEAWECIACGARMGYDTNETIPYSCPECNATTFAPLRHDCGEGCPGYKVAWDKVDEVLLRRKEGE